MQSANYFTPHIALPRLHKNRTDKNECFLLSEPMGRPASLRPLRLSVKKSRIAGSVRRKARAKRLLFERVSILLFSCASTAGSFLLLLFFGGTKKSKSLCKAPGNSIRHGHHFKTGSTLAILLFLTAAACNKDDDTKPADQLPPITMEGKGTFACLINGEVWKWKGRNPWNGFPNLDTSYGSPNNILRIQAVKDIQNDEDTLRQTFIIHQVVKDSGLYKLDSDQGKIFRDWDNEVPECISFYLDTLKSHYINILKIDTENKIAAGTFEFTVANECDTLRITEGRFDDFYRE